MSAATLRRFYKALARGRLITARVIEDGEVCIGDPVRRED
jgi:hypothetical protein